MAKMMLVTADTVYINGNIYTMDDCKPKASCLAVKGDRIVYIGGKVQVQSFIGKNTEVIDLGGKPVYPGFIESHMHLDQMAKKYLEVDIYRKPKEVILKNVKKRAEEAPNEWICGMGWFEDLWPEHEYPRKEELDAVAPDTPVFLARFGGHMYWANSKALELAGITEETENPQGGEYVRDEKGRLTGCLCDNARKPIEAVMPMLTGPGMQRGILKAQEKLLQTGITTLVHMGATKEFLEDVETLYKDGRLKVRGYYCLEGPSIQMSNELLEEWYKKGPLAGAYNNHFTVRAVKLFADGSLGARSAALEEDYSDRPGWNGSLLNTDEQYFAIVDRAAEAGFQVVTHAIGDRAVHQVMNAYEKVIRKHKLIDPRFHIEHFQVIDEGDAERAAEIGIIPSLQATNATFNYPMPEERLGMERAGNAYAWRKVIDAGNIIAGGTDAPITPVDPLVEMHSAVARMDDHNNPEGGWFMENAVTREEALKSQTIWAACAVFEEDMKGSLTPGKLADFVVTDYDIMTCDADKIKDVKIIRTVVGGETVFTVKVPDSGHGAEHARMRRPLDIGRASRYE